MAQQFIGVEVMILLKAAPPNPQLKIHGLVAGVAGQQLTLHNVIVPSTGSRLSSFVVEGDQIADLEVSSRPKEAVGSLTASKMVNMALPGHSSHHPAPYFAQQPHPPHSQHLPPPISGRLVDPAILSMGRKPRRSVNNGFSQAPQELLADVTKPQAALSKPSVSPPVSVAGATPPVHAVQLAGTADVSLRTPSATLSGPFNGLNMTGSTGDFYDTDEAVTMPSTAAAPGKPREPFPGPSLNSKQLLAHTLKKDGYTGKRSRRGGRAKALKDKTPPQIAPDTTDEFGTSPVAQRKNAQVDARRNRPWRQNVVSEDHNGSAVIAVTSGVGSGTVRRQAATSGNTTSRRSLAARSEPVDGWATEDATDIQGLGEFDFASNHAKFDKKTVFSQIRAEDTTADEARLVSHNRLQPRSGTGGGKNLHHTENVLDVPTNALDRWNSEAGDSDEEREEEGFGSGRSSRRAVSRQSSKQMPSRKGSAMVGMSASALLQSSLGRQQHLSSRTASPRGSTFSTAGGGGGGSSSLQAGTPASKPSFKIHPSGRSCPVVNPLQMLDVERIAEVELGLTEDMMTENAGRGVAEIVLSTLHPKGRPLVRGSQPLVVILAGNNKSGARAIAGGRHLRNHEVRVMICVLGLEREDELLEALQRQLKIFRHTGGRLSRWDTLAANLKALESGPELIVDALLGMHISFEDLRTDDQATAYELIQWANESRTAVMAVDVPSGIDASTGEISTLDGEPLHIKAKYVVAMGAPKQGLLNALISGYGDDWQVSVADIGICNMAWRKYGTRRRHGVEFANEWVVGLRFSRASE